MSGYTYFSADVTKALVTLAEGVAKIAGGVQDALSALADPGPEQADEKAEDPRIRVRDPFMAYEVLYASLINIRPRLALLTTAGAPELESLSIELARELRRAGYLIRQGPPGDE